MKAKELKEWRQKVLSRDNYTCQKCRSKEGKLLAHHIKSKEQYPALALKVSNGITLCLKCHKKVAVQAKLFGPDAIQASLFPRLRDDWHYPVRVEVLAKGK